MPIVDVSVVMESGRVVQAEWARAIADALGYALQLPPGRLWVRLQTLPAGQYAENAAEVSTAELPVFVTILHARPPGGVSLEEEVQVITRVVAETLGRPASHVHLEYATPGAGRLAFGGRLVR